MNKNKKIGAYGEHVAAQYLTRRGYKVLQKNYRSGRQEIDIIAAQNNSIIFIEVKTRLSQSYNGLESMHDLKLGALNYAIQEYLTSNKAWEQEVRADLILVLINKNTRTVKLKHYQGIL